MKPTSLILCASCCVAFTMQVAAQVSPHYVASVIEFGESFQDYGVADLNGDRRNDLVVSNWNEDQGRELWVYWQQADGKFPAQASRRIEIKRDIVAFALADVRSEPGDEFIFFTASAIFTYSSTHESYTNNLQKLCDWEFVGAVPSRRSTPLLGRFTDLDGDGRVDLLFPGFESYGFLSVGLAGNNHTSTQPTPIVLPKAEHRQLDDRAEGSVSIAMENGIKIEVTRPSAFDGLFTERLVIDEKKPFDSEGTFARYADPGNLLELERWIDSVEVAQLAPNQALEFIFLDDDVNAEKSAQRQRLNILTLANGKPLIQFQAGLEKRDEVKLFDFNDDGLMDILTIQKQGSDDVTASLFVNRQGKFNFQQTDQVIKLTGFDVNFRVADLNGDGHSDLLVGAFQISALNALRDGALVRLSMIYAGNPHFTLDQTSETPLFNRRLDFRLEENFSADDIKGLSSAVDFSLDINGDGNKDAIAVDKRGALTAKTLSRQWQLQGDAFWEFVPLHYILDVHDHDLNGDGKADFILRHQNALSLLVSQ